MPKHKKNDLLYHGSKIQGLSILKPNISDFERVLVYATESDIFPAIFINNPGGSFEAAWGKSSHGIPFYCERVPNVFERNYSKCVGSIYSLEKKYFYKMENLWEEEFVSDKEVPILKEMEISNVQDYLLKKQKLGKFIFIPFEYRFKYFPTIDEDLIQNSIECVKRFGEENVFSQLRIHHPQALIDEVQSRLKKLNITNDEKLIR